MCSRLRDTCALLLFLEPSFPLLHPLRLKLDSQAQRLSLRSPRSAQSNAARAERAAHLLQLATQRILQLRQRWLLPLRRWPGVVVCRFSFARPLHPSDLRQHRRARRGRSSCSAIARPHVAAHNNWHAAARRKGAATAAAWAWPTSSAAAAAEGHPPREDLGTMRCVVNEALGPPCCAAPRHGPANERARARRFKFRPHSRLALPRPCSAEAGACAMAQGALPAFPANSLLQVRWAAGNTLQVLSAAASDRVDTLNARWCVRLKRARACSRSP